MQLGLRIRIATHAFLATHRMRQECILVTSALLAISPRTTISLKFQKRQLYARVASLAPTHRMRHHQCVRIVHQAMLSQMRDQLIARSATLENMPRMTMRAVSTWRQQYAQNVRPGIGSKVRHQVSATHALQVTIRTKLVGPKSATDVNPVRIPVQTGSLFAASVSPENIKPTTQGQFVHLVRRETSRIQAANRRALHVKLERTLQKGVGRNALTVKWPSFLV